MDRRLLILALALVGLAALAGPAAAVLAGENGRIVFDSGRDADSDALAQLHFCWSPAAPAEAP